VRGVHVEPGRRRVVAVREDQFDVNGQAAALLGTNRAPSGVVQDAVWAISFHRSTASLAAASFRAASASPVCTSAGPEHATTKNAAKMVSSRFTSYHAE